MKDYNIGDKVKAFGDEYVIVGISTMIYDKDCTGEPEWKITKEIQEVAIAKDYPHVTYQKPSWINIKELQND